VDRSIVTIIAGLMFAAIMFPDHPGAQEGEFYAGKSLTLYAGMPVGGGVDDEMRLAARHLSRFIPGHPAIIARNMPGAGGVVLGNYLRHNAAPAAEYFGEVDPDVLVSAWMTTGDWAKKNPEIIKNFHAAIDEGPAFIKANPDEAKEIERKYIGSNSPRFPTFENTAKPDDLKVFIDIGKELGLYRTALDPQKLVLPR